MKQTNRNADVSVESKSKAEKIKELCERKNIECCWALKGQANEGKRFRVSIKGNPIKYAESDMMSQEEIGAMSYEELALLMKKLYEKIKESM